MTFKGGIIAESLEDKSALALVKIDKTVVENVTPHHKTPWLKQWTIHVVSVKDKDINKVVRLLSKSIDSKHKGSWYADLHNSSIHYIIFRNRFFKVDSRLGGRGYKKAVEYGLALGIPIYQLDFTPDVKKWIREKKPS